MTVYSYCVVRIMVFGVFIDVPLVVGGFILMLVYRDKLSVMIERLVGRRIPILGLYLLLSVPLIIFEEQINCMPAWCGQVLVPPTLPFILIEMLGLGLLSLKFKSKSSVRVTFAYSVFGVFWELFLGGLLGAPLLIAAVLAPYVMVSYMFVSLLPMNVLLDRKGVVGSRNSTTGVEPLNTPVTVDSLDCSA